MNWTNYDDDIVVIGYETAGESLTSTGELSLTWIDSKEWFQARDDNSRDTLRRALKEAHGAIFNKNVLDDLTDTHITEATINLLGVDRNSALCDWNLDPLDRSYKHPNKDGNCWRRITDEEDRARFALRVHDIYIDATAVIYCPSA